MVTGFPRVPKGTRTPVAGVKGRREMLILKDSYIRVGGCVGDLLFWQHFKYEIISL